MSIIIFKKSQSPQKKTTPVENLSLTAVVPGTTYSGVYNNIVYIIIIINILRSTWYLGIQLPVSTFQHVRTTSTCRLYDYTTSIYITCICVVVVQTK